MSPLPHILESLPVRLNKRYQWKSQDKVYNLKLYQSSVYLWIFSLTDSEAPIQSSGLMLTIITEKMVIDAWPEVHSFKTALWTCICIS